MAVVCSVLYCSCTHTSIAAMQGFDHHTKHEHNMWDYIYLCLELDRIDSSDQNAIQQFVYQQVRYLNRGIRRSTDECMVLATSNLCESAYFR